MKGISLLLNKGIPEFRSADGCMKTYFSAADSVPCCLSSAQIMYYSEKRLTCTGTDQHTERNEKLPWNNGILSKMLYHAYEKNGVLSILRRLFTVYFQQGFICLFFLFYKVYKVIK